MTTEVYTAITRVMADIAKEGISKDRKNQQQNYAFRGIDDVYNALAPILAKHKLCVLPRILSRTSTERQTQRGGVLFYVTVEAEYDLVSSEDGTKHTVRTFGEAMDTADKATNKAMSAAYKYMCMQTFCIPTEGEDNDADAITHDVKPTPTGVPDALVETFRAAIRDADASGLAEVAETLTRDDKQQIWAQLNADEHASLKKLMGKN